MNDVTRILSQLEEGDASAAEQLLPLVYEELRKLASARLAREKPGQTLQATALVHEAYMRLVGPNAGHPWHGRAHFFAAAAEAMRRILVERARQQLRKKHGGGLVRREALFEELAAPAISDPDELLFVHESLEALARTSPRRAELVRLRYFLGCTVAESAELLGISKATAEDDWIYAKAWLGRHLRRDQKES